MLCAGVLTAQFVAGTATRDALYFAHLSVSSLPQIVVATAVFSILLVAITAKAFRHAPPTSFVPAAFALSAVLFVGEWALARASPSRAAQLVYLHVSGFGPVLASGFWLIVTEDFDPRSAKKRFGQIAAVGTLGGVVGGLLAERVTTFFGLAAMLPVLATLSLLCAAQIYRLPRPADAADPRRTMELPADLAPDRPRSGLRVLGCTPYLRDLAALVLLGTIGAVLVDYVFKVSAVAVFGRGENLLRFFAIYYAAISLITFVVQTTSSRFVLERFGLTVATALPAAAVMLGGIGGLLIPGLASVVIARGGQAVFRGSVFRSGYEVLYTPVATADKRAAKSIIDVGFDKLGDALGAGIIWLVQSVAVATQYSAVLGAAVACSGMALVVSTRLRRGYVASLERSLVDRAVELDLTVVDDVLTRTVALRAMQRQAVIPVRAKAPAITARPDTEFLALVELRSRDRTRIVRVLRTNEAVAPLLVSHVVPLLGWDAVADDAMYALRKVAESRVGEFTDALLDPEQPFAVRRRLARVFSTCRSQRAVDGLMLGLGDQRFEVRFQCGRSLAAIAQANPGFQVDRTSAFAVVEREATVSRRVWESRQLLDRVDRDEAEPFVDEVVTDRANQSMAHVFTVLSLVLPREPLRIAFRALHTDDTRLRGTALEYLELILPPEIHERLSPFLDSSGTTSGGGRSRDAVLADLLLSNDSILINLSDLKRRALSAAERATT
jgi:hypothetical protein